jgi:uncharacterized oxidoreductase
MKLINRTILITGGTSGIGVELASELLARGNTVIVTGRNRQSLDTVQQQFPGIHVFQSDVSDPAAIASLYAVLTSQFPALDTLINNAGVMRKLDLVHDRDLVDVTREIEINFSGPVRMVQQFLPHLKTRAGALIVNVASVLAFVPMPDAPIYCATKAALRSYTRSLRVQLAGTNVTVVELAPPAVGTPMLADDFSEAMKGQKVMTVNDLVRQTITGIEGGKLEIRPGLSNILYLLERIAPRFALRQMMKRTRARL